MSAVTDPTISLPSPNYIPRLESPSSPSGDSLMAATGNRQDFRGSLQFDRPITFLTASPNSLPMLHSASSALAKRRLCGASPSLFHSHKTLNGGFDSPDSSRSITTSGSCSPAAVPALTRRSSSKTMKILSLTAARAKSRNARRTNDTMIYLEGPGVYACGECGTHMSTHDDVISKSFHGRHGRAYLLENCVNVEIGPAEDRRLMTGLHSVCDIFCKRCHTLVGWTYKRAYESSQKYKEGKFIVEKMFLHVVENDDGIRGGGIHDRHGSWRERSRDCSSAASSRCSSLSLSTSLLPNSMVYEY